jgi:hypothetical protein
MRYRLMATYRGAPYQAGIGPSSENVTLFAACPPPEEHGFRASSAGHWRKEVSVKEIDALWESRPIGSYRGERCMVLDDLGDRLHVAYLGRDPRQAKQLGYWQVDRGVFEVVVPRQEIRDLSEERTEYPLSMLMPALGRSVPGPIPDTAADSLAGLDADPLTGPAGSAGSAGSAGDWIGPANWDADDPRYPAGSTDLAAAWHGSPAPEEGGTWHDSGPIRGGGARIPGRDAGRNLPRDPARDLPRQPVRVPSRDPARDLSRDPARDLSRDPARVPERAAAAPEARRWDSYGDASDSMPGRRSARKPRVSTQWMFSELLDLAAIPHSAYAVEEEVPGAMCLLSTDGGFEVFSAADDARHEVRFFEDEEAAYFYLFGVLAAEAVRSGHLSPEPR